MKKKGLSVVVASVIMIALVMAAIVIVWSAVRNMIQNQVDSSGDCFDVEFSEKVVINDDYTCWNSTNESVHVSISIADEHIDGMLLSISSAGSSKGIELTNDVQYLADIKNYPDFTEGVKLPSINEGLTYFVTGFPQKPDVIKIAPRVGDNQCEQSDSVAQIEDCAIFV